MNQLLLPIGLVLIGAFLIILEAFIPSAGILAVLAAISLVCGVIAAFISGGLQVGTSFLFGTTVGVGALIAWLIRIWPNTALGRMILVEPPPEEELLPDRTEFQRLVGCVGKATSVMLPGGLVEIEGKRYEAIADKAIDEGSWVEVAGVKSGRILVVRSVSEDLRRKAEEETRKTQDPLSTPIDDLIDSFEDVE